VDNKVLIAGIAVVAVVVIIAVAAVMMNGGSDDSNKDYVVHDGNGGVDSDGNKTLKSKETVVMDNVFTNGSKSFNGWNTKADGTGTKYGPGANVMLGTKLYAQWVDGYKLTITHYPLIDMYISDDTRDMVKLEQLGTYLNKKGKATLYLGPADEVKLEGTWFTITKEGSLPITFQINMTGTDSCKLDVVEKAGKQYGSVEFTYHGDVDF